MNNENQTTLPSDEPKEATEIFIIETSIVTQMRYAIKATSLSEALSVVASTDCDVSDFDQTCLSEEVTRSYTVSQRDFIEKEANLDYMSTWSDEYKLKLIYEKKQKNLSIQ